MASKEKTRQFMEASDSHKHYSEIVDYTLTYFIHKAEREGNTRFAEDLKKEGVREGFIRASRSEAVYSGCWRRDLDDLIICTRILP
jgi:hypothetical protein